MSRWTEFDARRRHLVGALAGGLAGASLPALAALSITPSQTAGPFYPRRAPDERDDDLTHVAGQPAATGDHARLSGRVVSRQGLPIAEARVEIWQCDARAVYHHVGFAGGDPGFQGFGRCVTEASGDYAFRTIRPVPYGGRAPHVHVRVWQGDTIRLTTQIYIAGHPGNARDGLFDPALATDWTAGDGLVQARFDLVIDG